jgi:hypothetical protein
LPDPAQLNVDNSGLYLSEVFDMSDAQQRIDELVKSNEVLLFMKGTASFPQCGFSGRAIQILKACMSPASSRKL